MTDLPRKIDQAIGGAYELPDGRSFWLDHVAVKEIVRRIIPVLPPSSEAEIADLRAKLAQARDAGMRDMLNAILALNPEVAAKVARWREPPSPPNPEGKIPFEVALWVTEVATQLGIKSREEMGEEPLSLAGEEKTGASDV